MLPPLYSGEGKRSGGPSARRSGPDSVSPPGTTQVKKNQKKPPGSGSAGLEERIRFKRLGVTVPDSQEWRCGPAAGMKSDSSPLRALWTSCWHEVREAEEAIDPDNGHNHRRHIPPPPLVGLSGTAQEVKEAKEAQEVKEAKEAQEAGRGYRGCSGPRVDAADRSVLMDLLGPDGRFLDDYGRTKDQNHDPLDRGQ
ncbi:hypothetical protein EYF80_060506 [Liparis tanakae]|uniref:Uncharacterized protein n=1 Tax=Liparis tanakae TaxID=230148 RepID=A0A4Z2EK88_9TELE|nr:hypothetical protein EYF80_060506 [Liparis tanakae]